MPELNPCEQIWAYIKQRFKNKVYQNLNEIKIWLNEFVKKMDHTLIMSITSNRNYLNTWNAKLQNQNRISFIKKSKKNLDA